MIEDQILTLQMQDMSLSFLMKSDSIKDQLRQSQLKNLESILKAYYQLIIPSNRDIGKILKEVIKIQILCKGFWI